MGFPGGTAMRQLVVAISRRAPTLLMSIFVLLMLVLTQALKSLALIVLGVIWRIARGMGSRRIV